MRHVRMLGLCLMALLAMAATTAVVASPALATGEKETTEQEKEHEEKAQKKEPAKVAKFDEKRVGDPWGPFTWGQYKDCDWEANRFDQNCFMGITLGGSKGGFFEFGKVRVALSKSIILQGSFTGEEEEIQVEPPIAGAEALEAPELPVKDGINLFDKKTQEIEEWPAALTESWKEAKANGETAVDVKIEMAGNGCFEELGCLDSEHVLEEKGVAFKLPLKVKLTAPWLEKLGSEPCYIGNDEHPIHINLTTEGEGSAGTFTGDYGLINNELVDSRLVDLGWHIERASLPTNCGGSYSKYIGPSLAHVLELEGTNDSASVKTGIVVLQGDLHIGYVPAVKTRGVASGEL